MSSAQGAMLEWVGVQRLTPTGVVLDAVAVNICESNGAASLLFPTIATNGQENLCVMGRSGCGIYGSIFDSDLNILVDKFLINDLQIGTPKPREVSTNGNNFFITYCDLEYSDEQKTNRTKVKLVIVNPQGQILSNQDVWEKKFLEYSYCGLPTITTLKDTSYITLFSEQALWIRRYSADGNPIDPSSVKIIESQDFDLFLDPLAPGATAEGYTDLIWANEDFRFFLAKDVRFWNINVELQIQSIDN